MSVVVMGMEMPVSGTKYRVVEDMEGRKFLVEDDRLFERCFHLQPLPEKHGRLKDVDAILNEAGVGVMISGWGGNVSRNSVAIF